MNKVKKLIHLIVLSTFIFVFSYLLNIECSLAATLINNAFRKLPVQEFGFASKGEQFKEGLKIFFSPCCQIIIMYCDRDLELKVINCCTVIHTVFGTSYYHCTSTTI